MVDFFYQFLKEIKVFGLLLFSIATSFCCYAQENKEEAIDELLDALFFNGPQFLDELIAADYSYKFLYTSVSYNNNTFFSGRDTGTDQFNLIPQVSYYHSSGFNASVSGIYYENFSPSWDFTNVSLGYFNTLGKKKLLTYNLSYSKYFYSDDFDEFTNSFDITLGIRNNKRTIGTSIAASYLFGTAESYQLISSSFVNITLKRTSSIAFRLRPRLSFVIAKQTITIPKMVIVNRREILQNFNFEVFDLLNTQINIPISLSLKSWDFELGYNLNFPNALVNEDNLKTTTYFNLSVGYLFNLSK